MPNVTGKYKLESSEKFDEYMKALGVGVMTRTMANNATPVQEIKQDNEEFFIKTTTTFKTTEIKFKLNETFDETTGDGRKVKSLVSWDGDKLVHKQTGEPKDTTITREFTDDTMKMVLVVDDIVCTRVYKKVD